MAWSSRLLWSCFVLANIWLAYCALCLYLNYMKARQIGVPIRVIPIDHLNKVWLLVDRQVISLFKLLPGSLGKNNFTRYNYRGWHEHDGLRSHDELGEAFVLVTPSNIWLHLANPESLMDLYRRGNDFPRWTKITSVYSPFIVP